MGVHSNSSGRCGGNKVICYEYHSVSHIYVAALAMPNEYAHGETRCTHDKAYSVSLWPCLVHHVTN